MEHVGSLPVIQFFVTMLIVPDKVVFQSKCGRRRQVNRNQSLGGPADLE